MSILTKEEQHNGRNAVVCLKGFIKSLRKSNIDDQRCELALAFLKHIDDIFNKNRIKIIIRIWKFTVIKEK